MRSTVQTPSTELMPSLVEPGLLPRGQHPRFCRRPATRALVPSALGTASAMVIGRSPRRSTSAMMWFVQPFDDIHAVALRNARLVKTASGHRNLGKGER